MVALTGHGEERHVRHVGLVCKGLHCGRMSDITLGARAVQMAERYTELLFTL